jgi:hypothetical protein
MEGIALKDDIFALSARCTVYPFVLRNDQVVQDHNLDVPRA